MLWRNCGRLAACAARRAVAGVQRARQRWGLFLYRRGFQVVAPCTTESDHLACGALKACLSRRLTTWTRRVRCAWALCPGRGTRVMVRAHAGFTFYADLSIEVAPASETTVARALQVRAPARVCAPASPMVTPAVARL